MYAYGIDVSVWEQHVDWEKLKEQGFTFAFIGATRGTYEVKTFKEHWEGARQAGFLRGAYHFYLENYTYKQQSDRLLLSLGDDCGELPPVVDVEHDRQWSESQGKVITIPINNPGKFANGIYNWLQDIEKRIKRRPTIYTNQSFWSENMRIGGMFPSWASSYLLWVANYINLPFQSRTVLTQDQVVTTADKIDQQNYLPALPKSWTTWKFWQITGDTYFLDGVKTTDQVGQVVPAAVDINIFHGTEDELRAMAQGFIIDHDHDHIIHYIDITKFTNQKVMAAFFMAFGSTGGDVLKNTGLLPQLCSNPTSLYTGPAIADITNLSYEQELALQSALARQVSNQKMINAFYAAFGAASYWEVVVRAGLANIANNRQALYTGPGIDDLPLTDDEKDALKAVFPY